MSDNEIPERDHEKQHVLLSETKSSITIEVGDSKVETSKDCIDNMTDVAKERLAEADTCVSIYKCDDEKQNVKDNEKNEKGLENTYIALRVFETYFGAPQLQPSPIAPNAPFATFPQYDSGYYNPDSAIAPQNRSSFVRTVFMILFVMIALTCGIVATFLSIPSLKVMFLRHYLIFLICGIILALTTHYAIYCSACSRTMPCCLIILALTLQLVEVYIQLLPIFSIFHEVIFFSVVAFSLLAGGLSARYRTSLIFYAILATGAVVFVCLVLACTSFDFTRWYLYLVVITVAFSAISAIIFVSVLITKEYPQPLQIARLVIGAVIEAVFLVIEIQMILGGKTIQLNEEDYALAAYMLYTSVISLFTDLLRLIGMSD